MYINHLCTTKRNIKGGAGARATRATTRRRGQIKSEDELQSEDEMRARILMNGILAPSEDSPNLYVSMHSCPIDPVRPRGLDIPEETEIEQNIIDTYTALVPNNLIVVLFTPTDMVAMTTEDSEQMDRQLLSNLDWVTINDELSRNAKIYFPGDKLYNQNMSFDHEDDYFNIFKILPTNITDEDTKRAVADEGSELQVITYRELNHPRQLNQPYNLRITPYRREQHDPYTDMKTSMLLDIISANTPHMSRRSNKLRIVYIMSCNPAINLNDIENVWKSTHDQRIALTTFNRLRTKYETHGRKQFRRLQQIIMQNLSMQTRKQKSTRVSNMRARWKFGAPTFGRTISDGEQVQKILELLAQESEDKARGIKIRHKRRRSKRRKHHSKRSKHHSKRSKRSKRK